MTYEQHNSQNSQSSEFGFNNVDENCYSEENDSESSIDTAQDQMQIINDSSSINFSPESKRPRVSSFKNGLTPQLHHANQDNDTKQQM